MVLSGTCFLFFLFFHDKKQQQQQSKKTDIRIEKKMNFFIGNIKRNESFLSFVRMYHYYYRRKPKIKNPRVFFVTYRLLIHASMFLFFCIMIRLLVNSGSSIDLSYRIHTFMSRLQTMDNVPKEKGKQLFFFYQSSFSIWSS
mgnify:CR=1 FL=1